MYVWAQRGIKSHTCNNTHMRRYMKDRAVVVSFNGSSIKRLKNWLLSIFPLTVLPAIRRLLNIENLSRWFKPRSTKPKLPSLSRRERASNSRRNTSNSASIKFHYFIVQVHGHVILRNFFYIYKFRYKYINNSL